MYQNLTERLALYISTGVELPVNNYDLYGLSFLSFSAPERSN